MKTITRLGVLTATALASAIGLLAQTNAPPDLAARVAALESATQSAQSAGDNAWMLTSSALVLMMTGPGLALFYGGLVRKKNVLATMMQSFLISNWSKWPRAEHAAALWTLPLRRSDL